MLTIISHHVDHNRSSSMGKRLFWPMNPATTYPTMNLGQTIPCTTALMYVVASVGMCLGQTIPRTTALMYVVANVKPITHPFPTPTLPFCKTTFSVHTHISPTHTFSFTHTFLPHTLFVSTHTCSPTHSWALCTF